MAQTFVFSATSHGLRTCLMEGYDSRRVREVLKIPDRYDVPLMCCIGYEYEGEDADSLQKAPRLRANEVFFSDLFGQELDLKAGNDDEDVSKKIAWRYSFRWSINFYLRLCNDIRTRGIVRNMDFSWDLKAMGSIILSFRRKI